jgi:hypothetical protein
VGEDGGGEGDEGGDGDGEPGPGIGVGGVATVTAGVGGGAGVGGTGAGGTGAGAGGVVGTGRETVGTVTVTPGTPTSPSAWAESAPASTPATASAAATTAVLTFLAMLPSWKDAMGDEILRIGANVAGGAHSSAGERSLHTREVPGSIPGAPTERGSAAFSRRARSDATARKLPSRTPETRDDVARRRSSGRGGSRR